MPEQASAAFAKIQSLTSDPATLNALRAEIDAATQLTSTPTEAAAVEAAPEFSIDEPAAEFAVDEIPAAIEEAPGEDAPATVETIPVPVPVTKAPAPPVLHVEPAAIEEPAVSEAPVAGVLQEFVSDLESSLGETFIPGAVPHEPVVEQASAASQTAHHAPPELEPVGHAAPTTFGVSQAEPMGEFVADLEASLGDDFLKDAPLPEPQSATQTHPAPRIETPVAAPPAQHWPVHAPATSAPVSAPVATNAAAAAASSGVPTVSSRTAPPVPAMPKSPVSPAVSGSAFATKSSPFGEDASVDLAEMFGELKQDLESGSATTEEDPETHYNLGIAFREMGLLDEAIGELQKTCQAVDRGHPFPQAMQTYTWLAQCFLDKGMPEAAIRWYDKALHAPRIDEETRTALHYELAAAYESAGDRPSALKHFMEVYGRNIDYRDVAERIKPLKS
jgi:hypothetical protein